jgi:hypothetical protein
MNNTTAKDLKIGSKFRQNGSLHYVVNITNEEYLNGNKAVMVECESEHKHYGKGTSTFHFKLATKINII